MKDSNKVTTTVCVERADRNAIKEYADDLHLSQRQMVTRLIDTYRVSLLRDDCNTGVGPPEDILSSLQDGLEKVIKRDDRVIAFIREQERVLLKPILQTVQSIDAKIKLLNDILSNLD